MSDSRIVVAPEDSKIQGAVVVPDALDDMDQYQGLAIRTIQSKSVGDQSDRIATMFGLASATGCILDVYKRYARDSIDGVSHKEIIQEELGDLLWYIAAVASMCGLRLSEIASANLRRLAPLTSDQSLSPFGLSQQDLAALECDAALHKSLTFRDYQIQAIKSSRLNLRGPEGPIAPMFGLASAMGKILHFGAMKYPVLRLKEQTEYFKKELGDLLWYLAVVAEASDRQLSEIARKNLERVSDLYLPPGTKFEDKLTSLPVFDSEYLPTERFPRRMVFYFEEDNSTPPVVTAKIILAEPNEFKSGSRTVKLDENDVTVGFDIEAPLGNNVTDNSKRPDGYRYHDAIHISFMSVLGWSPTMRKLLGVRRGSDPGTVRDEDGARSRFTEEGLSAFLSRLAPKRLQFQGENNIDGTVIDIAKEAVRDMEAKSLPGWLWRRAICKGFRAMENLKENRGGYLVADLNSRDLTYSKTRPAAD